MFPVLKPARWQGLELGARAHVWIGTPAEPVLVVAYGCFEGGLLSYVTNDVSGYGHPDVLVREAFDNLAAHPIELQVVGAGADQVLLTAGPLTAEQVLSEAHMLRAHEKLGVDRIVVSIARRDAFMACAAEASDQLRRTMAALHLEAWANGDAHRERLLGDLIVFERGLKVGTIEVGAAVGAEGPWGRWAP